jgi:hypothetical protein
MRDYLQYVSREARRRFESGMDAEQCAFDIAIDDFASWGDAERIAVNVDALYREFREVGSDPDFARWFDLMARVDRARRGARPVR